MKRLILFELLLLILATTFESDSPPGWFQQTLPVNDQINDIFFLDSLTGWVVTQGGNSDTSRIMKTTNGGTNWVIQNDSLFNLIVIQFPDINTGYAAGGNGRAKFLKTTNGGNLWAVNTPFGSNMYAILDMFFINKDTGWICSDDSFGGGIYKTTNGGLNWLPQLDQSYQPQKLFFINNDTGWAGSANWKLYRTTNSGVNWSLQFTSNSAITSIFFLNGQKGWIRGGTGNGVAYTTNGGFNWTSAQGEVAGYDLRFVNDSVGYSGMIDFKVTKSTNGGKIWGTQTSPIISNLSTWMFRNDTLRGWAGSIGFIKTTDGGGNITYSGITQVSNEIPTDYKLEQNYPNPFNPTTNIRYSLPRPSEGGEQNVKLVIFDITGREITALVNEEQTAGTYQVDWNASGFASGVYFYSLIIDGVVFETKKMLMVK